MLAVCIIILGFVIGIYVKVRDSDTRRTLLTMVGACSVAVLATSCSKGETNTSTPTPEYTTHTQYSKAVVVQHERDMQVVVTISDTRAYVDCITITFSGVTTVSDYLDLCAYWWRVEDQYGLTWTGTPSGTTFTIIPSPGGGWLSGGTWICTIPFLGRDVPTISGVSVHEIVR